MPGRFDDYNSGLENLDSPASSAFAVVPSDTIALAFVTRGLFVGGAGNITCRLVGDSVDVVFTGVIAGAILPFRIKYIRATGTTATNMTALV